MCWAYLGSRWPVSAQHEFQAARASSANIVHWPQWALTMPGQSNPFDTTWDKCYGFSDKGPNEQWVKNTIVML